MSAPELGCVALEPGTLRGRVAAPPPRGRGPGCPLRRALGTAGRPPWRT